MITIEDLKEHCEKQLERLPKRSKMYEEHLLTLNIINELQQKDKQIDLMVEKIYKRISAKELDKYCNKQKNNCKNYEDCFKCIKQYFETKAKKGE